MKQEGYTVVLYRILNSFFLNEQYLTLTLNTFEPLNILINCQYKGKNISSIHSSKYDSIYTEQGD